MIIRRWQEYSGVSIHASAREATSEISIFIYKLLCFNPRLRTGGDDAYKEWRNKRREFQSTPPHGRRQPSRYSLKRQAYVSIHASAREATFLFPNI